MITVGVDVGSLATKVALLDGDRLAAYRVVRTTGTVGDEVDVLVAQALAEAGAPRAALATVAATGSGADLVRQASFAEEEVACVAAAVSYFLPGVERVVHMGGQSIAVMSVSDDGGLGSFVRNDKCAAGTGRFLEMMARKMGVDLEEVDGLVARAGRPAAVSHQCVVYAESEAISRLNDGSRPEDILAGICDSLARIITAQGRRYRGSGGYALTGGLARCRAVASRVEAGLAGERVAFPFDPSLAAAIGAALLEEDGGPP